METISVKEARPLFLTRDGMPRKECLLLIEEICAELHKPLSGDPVKRAYQLQFARSVMSAIKKYFHEHHVGFIAPRIEGKDGTHRVYYGFSGDQKLVENYIERIHRHALSYRRIENEMKLISTGQLPLLPLKASGE